MIDGPARHPARPLTRHAYRGRRRAIGLAVVGGILAHGALVAVLAAALDDRAPVASRPPAPAAPAVVVTPQVVVVPGAAPVAEPAPVAELAPCPAPVTRAPRGALDPELPTGMTGIAASPTDARRVVAWGAWGVYASDDGGARFTRVLDGPGLVDDAAFDCHGRLFVMRGGERLGVRDGDHERWRDVAGFATPERAEHYTRNVPRLAGGGPRIAIAGIADDDGRQRLALSDDAGATWRYADVGWGEDPAAVQVSPEGVVTAVLPWVDCDSEGVRRVVVSDRGIVVDEEIGWLDATALAPHGLWGIHRACVERMSACRWRSTGWEPVQLPRGARVGEDEPRIYVGGGAPRRIAAGAVWALDTRRRVGAFREDATPVVADAAGRVWGLTEAGEVVRSQ